MGIEFVDPAPPVPVAPVRAVGAVAPAWPGRVAAAGAAVGAVLVFVALAVPLYTLRQTAFIVDFDHTTSRSRDTVVDAFGGGGGTDHGWVWAGLAAALLVAAAVLALRPRLTGARLVVAALAGVLLGTMTTLLLELHGYPDRSVANVRFSVLLDAGSWLVLAGGALPLLGLLAASAAVWVVRPRRGRSVVPFSDIGVDS